MPKAKKTDKQRIYILDTNIFMADPDCMNRFGKHMIVVPDMVIEELDDNKKASGDKGYNTRQSLRNFDSLRRKGNLIKGVPTESGGSIRITSDYDHVILPSGWKDKPDNRILQVAKGMKEESEQPVILVSKDTNVRIKADILKVKAEDYKHEMIDNNPAVKVSLPKIHDKNIIRLDVDEVAQLLDEVESGESLSKRQQMYHERTKKRDLALLSLMLGTGIRVSECVGLNLDDIDFKNNGIKVHRKGGAEVVVYFSDEVCAALCDYLEERQGITTVAGHEDAVFLSMQNRRITVRAVENLVKKYSKLVTNIKNITPHKLRSTYGTSLYKATGDIYLVADVLGHKDVNTTKKHYAALEDDRRRKAAKYVHLRED